jgi:hypothetical protein
MIDSVLLTGLLRIELPIRDVLLCDGGFVRWGDQVFEVEDPDFGVLVGFEALTEGVGDEAPAGTLSMATPTTAAAALLSQPGYQGSRVRLWVAEIDEVTGAIVGEPDLMVDWQIDSTRLRSARGARTLEIGCVTRGQRLMLVNDGNTLAPAYHRALHPGEAGLDNATGLTVDVAWGAASAPRGVAAVGGGSGSAARSSVNAL